MESELGNYIMIESIRGLALLATINIVGFVSSLENTRISNMSKELDEARYSWTALDRAMEFVSKPGRNLAYLISKR